MAPPKSAPKAPKCETCGARHYSTQDHAGSKELTLASSALDLAGFEASATALLLPADLGFEEWLTLGDQLDRMGRAVMWWIGDWWRFGDHHYGERATAALKSGRYAFQTFMDAGWVAGKIETSRRREVLSWSHHREVAALEVAEQDRLLDEAEAKDWMRSDVRAAVRRLRTAERIGRAAGEAGDLAAAGVFQVLYADPPWQYEDAEPTRAIENNYQPMSLEEIKALTVPAADDSVLFLWATSPKLEEAIEVINAWGFEYRTCLVWVKGESLEEPTMGMGYYVRQAHELLLIAKRGQLPVPAPENRPLSVLVAPRGAIHSQKPAEVYTLIEQMYPDFSKKELFARDERPGWSTWGDQSRARGDEGL